VGKTLELNELEARLVFDHMVYIMESTVDSYELGEIVDNVEDELMGAYRLVNKIVVVYGWGMPATAAMVRAWDYCSGVQGCKHEYLAGGDLVCMHCGKSYIGKSASGMLEEIEEEFDMVEEMDYSHLVESEDKQEATEEFKELLQDYGLYVGTLLSEGSVDIQELEPVQYIEQELEHGRGASRSVCEEFLLKFMEEHQVMVWGEMRTWE
jgi:hypothetical protein